MKSLIRLFISLMAVAAVSVVQAQSLTEVYIVPADGSGKVVAAANGGYEGQIQLATADSTVFTGVDIEIPSGYYAIYAANSKGEYSFYKLPTYAVQPMPVNLPSPLTIGVDGTTIELPAGGTYDFELYTRDIEGISTHMVIARPKASEVFPAYPSQLYLISSDGSMETVAGDQYSGVYETTSTPGPDFRISYEPRSIDAFIFGPTGGSGVVTLGNTTQIEIAYGTNTEAVFNVGATTFGAGDPRITIDLRRGYIEYSREFVTGVEEVAATQGEAQYYTLSGMPVTGEPERGGVYVAVRDGRAMKVRY